jgi:hypothetical protein
LLIVTPPAAVCANAPEANAKDINRIGKSFVIANSLFVGGTASTREVDSWMTAGVATRVPGSLGKIFGRMARLGSHRAWIMATSSNAQ